MPADFADDKQHIMRFHGGALLRDFDDIMVIRTGKAFIRRDNKIAFAPFGAFALRACIKNSVPASGETSRIFARPSCIIKRRALCF